MEATQKKKPQKKRREACVCGATALRIHKDDNDNETGVVSCAICRRRYVTKGIRFWLYPTPEQERRLWTFGNAARHAWNWVVRLCDDEYEQALESAGVWKRWEKRPRTRPQRVAHAAQRSAAYKKARAEGKKIERPPINLKRLYDAYCNFRDNDPEGAWIRHRKIHSHVYSYPIQSLVKAYAAFWKGLKTGRDNGMPRGKRRGTLPAFTIQIFNRHLATYALSIPGIGAVSTRQSGRTKKWVDQNGRDRGGHRLRRCGKDPLVACSRGEACTITVRYVVDHWEASVTMRDVEVVPLAPPSKGPVGIDLGRTHFLTCASETIWREEPEGLRAFEAKQDRLARLQRKLQKRKPGSNRHARLRLQIAKLHDDVARKRADFLHRLSYRLVAQHSALAIEGFDVKKLVSEEVEFRKHRRRIMDGAWGEFRRQLTYKAQWYDRLLLRQPEFSKTDQECWICGAANKMPTTSKYVCGACGNETTRQINTARLLEKSFLRSPQGNSPVPEGPGEGTPSVGGTHARPSVPDEGTGVSPRPGGRGARRSGPPGAERRVDSTPISAQLADPRRNVE